MSTAVTHNTMYAKGGGGASGGAPVGPSTGATAGSPGTWTPAGSRPPASLADTTGVTANPATNWTAGQYVVTRDGTKVRWTSTVWAVAP